MYRNLLGLIPSAGGNVKVLGQELVKGHGRRRASQGKGLKGLRRRVGVIFQDPAASLNPRLPIGNISTAKSCITMTHVARKLSFSTFCL